MYKMTIKKCSAKGISLRLNKECPLKLGTKIIITPIKPKKIATILDSITFSFINNVAKKVAKIGAELPIAETSAREDNVRDVNQKYKASALIIDRIK